MNIIEATQKAEIIMHRRRGKLIGIEYTGNKGKKGLHGKIYYGDSMYDWISWQFIKIRATLESLLQADSPS